MIRPTTIYIFEHTGFKRLYFEKEGRHSTHKAIKILKLKETKKCRMNKAI